MSLWSQQSNTLNNSSSSTFLLHQVKFCKCRILPPRATVNQLLWPKQTCRRWEGRGKTDFFDTSKCFEFHPEGREKDAPLLTVLWIWNPSSFILQIFETFMCYSVPGTMPVAEARMLNKTDQILAAYERDRK